MLSMIDVAVTREQFATFPPDIAMRLLTAAEADITAWSDRLITAWIDADAESIQRARHALKGLCGNFGAVKLQKMCDDELASAEAQAALLALRASTLSAIRMIALGAPEHPDRKNA